jgi:hypothetical protein
MTLILLFLLQAQPPAPQQPQAPQQADPEDPKKRSLPQPRFADPPPGQPPEQYDPDKVQRGEPPPRVSTPPSQPASTPRKRPRVVPPQQLPDEPDVQQRGQNDPVRQAPPVASIENASVSRPQPLAREAEMTSLEKMMLRSEGSVSLTTVIDELLDELVAKMSKQDAHLMSPLAIRWIKISPLLRADLAQSIDTRLTARLAEHTDVTQVVCADCRALRSRIEGREWVVSLGVVHQADLRRVAEDIGAKAFIDIDLDYTPAPPQTQVVLSARIFRASDARVLYATAIRADETTAAVLRTGKKPVSRDEQLAELERKLQSKPYYGLQTTIGMMWFPYDEPIKGTIGGAAVSASAYERFGIDRRHMYGINGQMFLNPNRLQAGMLMAFYGYQITEPDLNKPEIDLSWEGGAFIATASADQGNSVIFASNIDVVMRWRFSFGGGLIYLIPTKYDDGSGVHDLGGLGVQTRFGFNW